MDYEEMILIRQDLQEIYEDGPDDPVIEWWHYVPDEDFEVINHGNILK